MIFMPIIGVASHLKTSRAKLVHASFQSLLTLLLGTSIGMGTKIHCKTYLPGYPTRDLNDGATFSCSSFCQDKTFIRQLYNNFNPKEVSNLPEFEKEMLKRTILEHEAIFQKQLYELHRIYRTQKELMHELKLKRLNRLPGPSETCKSSMYTTHLNSAFDGKKWHLPYPSLVSTCWSSANVVDGDDKKDTSKLKKFAKSLDLHLPSEAFIEKEDTEKTEREDVAHPCFMTTETLNMIHGNETDNDVKLSLGSFQVTGSGRDTLKLNLHPINGLSANRLADLNEPVVDSINNRAVSSCTRKLGLPEVHQQPWTPSESKTSSLRMDLFNDGNSSLDIKVEMGQGNQQFYSCSGQTKMVVNSFDSGLLTDRYPIPSKLVRLKFDSSEERHMPYRKLTNTLVQEKSAQSSGNYGINSKKPGFKAFQVASLSDASPLSNAAAIPSSVSSWGKPIKNRDHIPVSVQAFASSNTSSFSFEFSQCNTDAGDKPQCNGYQHPQMRHDYKSSAHTNGLCHGTQKKSTSLTRIHLLQRNPEESYLSNRNGTSRHGNPGHHEPQQHLNGFGFIDVRSVENLSLNKAFPCGIEDSITNQKELAKNHDESSGGLVWVKERSFCNASSNTEECESQLDLRFDKDKSQLNFTEYQGEEVMDHDICSLRRSDLAVDAKETRIQKHLMPGSKASEGVFSLADHFWRKINFSNSVSYNGQPLHDHAKSSEKERQIRNCSPSFRNDINLNSEPVIADNSLLECKREIPSVSLVRGVGKPTCRIDLEIPADELEEDNTTYQIQFVDFNDPTATVKISEEKTSSQYICTRLAAEAIVSMSVDSRNRLTKVSKFPFLPFPCDYLHLLAEVVTSNAESCEALLLDDQFDAFELMTMELEELRTDEYCCNPCHHERANNENSMASLLSRPCRGQARRRQKRDFQKDVLPGLASLSRHEVAEDLQVLGGITRIGKAHQTRKPSALSRRRRRPTSLSITSSDVCDKAAQIHPIHAELEDAGKNIMTWGRTTRRCPRQRTPTGNTYTPQE